MSTHPLQYLIPAALLGILGDGLLRGMPWGLNVPLCVAGLAVAISFMPGDRRPALRDATALIWAAVITAAALAWRAAETLVLANLLATGALLVLALIRATGVRIESAALVRLAVHAVRAGGTVAAGAVPCLTGWRPSPAPAADRKWRAVFTGVALAVPVFGVFTALLANADPLFERAVSALFEWDPGPVASHAAVSAGLAWLACGFLVGVHRPDAPANHPGRPALASLGLIEVGIPLGGLAGIFAVFVGFQARYFFGGDAVVLTTADLGYAEYARRGFFELVAVTALVVPLLLAADGVVDREHRPTVRGVRILSVILLGLVSLIAASALYRLWLYYVAYGLTPTRVHAAAFMIWIGAVLGWFGVTVLRERRGAFPIGAFVSGLVVLAGLNILNPDALVARVNLSRAAAGAEVDVALLAQLSSDAAPTLIRDGRRLSASQQCEMARAVSAGWRDSTTDWRTWSVSRARARMAARDAAVGCS